MSTIFMRTARVIVVLVLGAGPIPGLIVVSMPLVDAAPTNGGDSGRNPLRIVDNLFDQRNPVTLGLPNIQAKHQVLYRASVDGYKFCHQQNLGVWNGKLYLMWSNGLTHEDHNGQRILYCSTDDGQHWSKPTVLAEDHDGPGPLACVSAGWHDAGETLVAYYTAIPEGRPGIDERNTLFHLTTKDGRTWSRPNKLAQGFFIEGPRRLPGGRLLMNGQWAHRQPRLRYTDSFDGISGWQDGEIPDVDGVYTFPEPSWYVRPDGSLVMIFRTKSGDPWIYASESRDNGQSWSKPTKTNFPDATARAFAGNLPDGTAFIISNPATKPSDTHPNIGRRNPLTIALSDDGKVFDRAYTIRAEPTSMRFHGKNKVNGWQYPTSVAWNDQLYVAYSINKEDEGISQISLSDLQVASSRFGADRRSYPKSALPIRVVNPSRFAVDRVPAHRVPLGIAHDYKPWLVQQKNDELLLVAFHHWIDTDPPQEHAVFWRSRDGGKTWSSRTPRADIKGREFSGACLSDGTILMPCWIASLDIANLRGDKNGYSMLYRSEDLGATWTVLRIGADLPQPPRRSKGTLANLNRVVVEVQDPENPEQLIAALGTSQAWSAAESRWWLSRDSGRTWDRTFQPDTEGWDDGDGFFGQSFTYRARSDRLLHVLRVTSSGKYYEIPDVKPVRQKGDPADRMMLWESLDNGGSWKKVNRHGTFGTYGEMFPRLLRLHEGKLLLTFTARSDPTDGYPKGLRAIVSPDDGTTWDFSHDRFIIDYQNRGPTGGGYGNTVQTSDGTLVSCYSYRGSDNATWVEAVRWRLPAPQTSTP